MICSFWSGQARCDDPDYLADRQADAGRMVGERARTELLARAHAANGDRVHRWLRAAADLAPDRARRADTLMEHAIACLVSGKSAECLASTDTLLHELSDQLSPERLQEAHLTHVAALHATGDLVTTEQIARGEWWPWPGRPVEQAISRAGALYALGRWQQVRDLLADTDRLWRGFPDARRQAELLESLAGLWLGEREQFDRGLAALFDRGGDPGDHRRQMIHYVGALLTVGEIEPTLRLLAGNGRESLLGLAEQAGFAARRGRFDEALELTRQRILRGPSFGYGPSEVAMFQSASVILLARGRVSRARDLLTGVQAAQPVLPHLLAGVEAWICTALGEYERARAMVDASLVKATEAGEVVGIDELCFVAFHHAFVAGDLASAASCVRRAELVARRLGTPRARMNSLLVEAALNSDRDAGAAALRLARELGEPLRLASVIEQLVRYGAAEPRLLPEAYEILGELDALLLRSWTRTLMREHNIPIPGRQSTVAETQRLLAVLVADGLGNRQLATVLQTSEKSVEGKLSRLFQQTGYRSRVELAMAIFNGQLEV
ncbi:response regulator transcription factor [Kutzneria sp. 744]|uniref:response regulator transcription factor n=1 Tax=Kutzneria sp. (strain 744) TaxID=345341 RepID=UPI0003EED9C2|nr:response regulator transcription factor [Kutzneria sp. 744]EWM19080.1 LigA protein [Kutzneria sp. 744]